MKPLNGNLGHFANVGESGIRTTQSYGRSTLTPAQRAFRKKQHDAHILVLNHEAVHGKRETQVKFGFNLSVLNSAIKAHGWTQRRLGKACDCSDATISLTKRGKPVGEEIAKRICEVLGLQFEDVTFEVVE